VRYTLILFGKGEKGKEKREKGKKQYLIVPRTAIGIVNYAYIKI
jgi:hypothetical protein